MKPNPGTTSASDKRLSRLLRLGVAVLVVGVMAFVALYYQDQHVDAGPSMSARQISAAEAAVRKTPTNVGARIALAAAYQQEKRYDDALKQYDEILRAAPKNKSALLGRGAVLISKNDLTAAAATYRKITSGSTKAEFSNVDPQLEEAYYYLGSIAMKQGKTKDAITELQTALTIVRSDSDALYLLGVARLKEGEPKLAVESLTQALLFVPTGWCEPYSQLAVAYGKLNLAPQKTYATGMANFCLKKPAEAKAQLKSLLKGPRAVDAMLGLGLFAEQESNNPEAVSWYKQVLTLDKKNATATAALSRLGAGPTSPAPAAKGSSTTQGPS